MDDVPYSYNLPANYQVMQKEMCLQIELWKPPVIIFLYVLVFKWVSFTNGREWPNFLRSLNGAQPITGSKTLGIQYPKLDTIAVYLCCYMYKSHSDT